MIRFRDLPPELQRAAEFSRARELRAVLPSEHEQAILQIARTLAEEADYSERDIGMLARDAARRDRGAVDRITTSGPSSCIDR
jgi:hypothetical protein